MRILFLTRSKPYTELLLQTLIKKGHTVAVLCKSFSDFAGSSMEALCRARDDLIRYIRCAFVKEAA